MMHYCNENNLKVNTEKTRVALFNTAYKYDFQLHLTTGGVTQLEFVEEFRLLGIIFKSNLSWEANTNHMFQKGYSIIWMLRRLSKLGANKPRCLIFTINRLDVF